MTKCASSLPWTVLRRKPPQTRARAHAAALRRAHGGARRAACECVHYVRETASRAEPNADHPFWFARAEQMPNGKGKVLFRARRRESQAGSGV